MRMGLLRVLVLAVSVFLSVTEAHPWSETTHCQYLTAMALELVRLDDEEKEQECLRNKEQVCTGRYHREIWFLYGNKIIYGAGDEDFPCPEYWTELLKQQIEKDFFRYGVMLNCRTNNHYFHPLSGVGRRQIGIMSRNGQHQVSQGTET